MERIITEETIQDFSSWLKAAEKSKNTVEKYLRDVKAFAGSMVLSSENFAQITLPRNMLRNRLACAITLDVEMD